MSKVINTQGQNATNIVNIVGKLMDVTFRTGKTTAGDEYESANMTIRVQQTYGGRTEVEEVPVSMFAQKYTKKTGGLNPGWTQIQDLKNFKTAQNVGIDEATVVRVSGASIQENNFMSRNGTLVNTWQINASFVGVANNLADTASFSVDIYINDVIDEMDRNGEPTGRLVVQSGLVQYGGKLDVLNFIVEAPDNVNFVRANWHSQDTLNVKGRIRVTTNEEAATSTSSWGEDIPESTVRTVRELIITTGDDCGREEDFAYSPEDIFKLGQARKARLEQLRINAEAKKPAATPASNKFAWD